MVRKYSLYTTAIAVWGVIVIGVTAAIYAGWTAPAVTREMLPLGESVGFLALPVALVVAGALVLGVARTRAWRRAGAEADLDPEDGGAFSTPDLVGDRNGRPVRARVVEHMAGDGEGDSTEERFTVVEADLEGAAEEGLVVGDDDDLGAVVDLPLEVQPERVDGFAALSQSTDLGEAVLTSRARSALAEPSRCGEVLAGNASEVLIGSVSDDGGMMAEVLSDGVEAKVERRVPGDAATVRMESEGVLLDGAEMRAQVEAVTAVAEEFEGATSG